MKVIYNIPRVYKIRKIISKSSSLHEKYGKDLRIQIIGTACQMFGRNFMKKPHHECVFYVKRYCSGESPEKKGEVYRGVIWGTKLPDFDLVHESEIGEELKL